MVSFFGPGYSNGREDIKEKMSGAILKILPKKSECPNVYKIAVRYCLEMLNICGEAAEKVELFLNIRLWNVAETIIIDNRFFVVLFGWFHLNTPILLQFAHSDRDDKKMFTLAEISQRKAEPSKSNWRSQISKKSCISQLIAC
jgi:hypothetical protein